MCEGAGVLACYVCNGVGYLGSSGALVCRYCGGEKVVGCPLCTDQDDPYQLSYVDRKTDAYPYPYDPEKHDELDPDTKVT